MERAVCQLVHVEGEGETLVLDLLPLDVSSSESDEPLQPVTVGLSMTGAVGGEFDDLYDTLDRWTRGPDDILDLYVLPVAGRRRIVLVHAGDVVVIETESD
jgi:hypothetical protein